MRKTFLLSTLSGLVLAESHGSFAIESSDLRCEASVRQVSYEEGVFSLENREGEVKHIALSSVRGMEDIPLSDVQHVISNHLGWLDVKSTDENDSSYSLRFNLRLRGGRGITEA